jgi:hypothetical protein
MAAGLLSLACFPFLEKLPLSDVVSGKAFNISFLLQVSAKLLFVYGGGLAL